MQAGDYFKKLADYEAQLGQSFQKRGFLTSHYIHSLKQYPDTAAWKPHFYDPHCIWKRIMTKI